MRHLSLVAAAAFAVILLPHFAFAQSSSGTVSGRVLDPSGQFVPAAEVSLVNQDTRDTRSVSTNEAGDFVFASVDPGTFTLIVKAQGFKTYERKNVSLSASERLSAGDLKLEVGAVSETVEVKEEAAVVQTVSGERSALLDSHQIMDLMSRGRDIMGLLQILPGVANDATGADTLGTFTSPSINGVRSYYNGLNVDGISGNTRSGINLDQPINMDAIAEVKVLANTYQAEYGKAAGSVINIVTKGGTQTFHGSAYYYNRNEALNANNFFNNRAQPFVPRPRYRYNTAGWNLGGPIFIPHHFNADKQKLFFFFSQEILPNQSPNSVRNYTVPTTAERTGDFSQSLNTGGKLITVKDPTTGVAFPGNVIPASRIDPNTAKLLSIFPLPNTTNRALTGGVYNFQIAGSEDRPVSQEILRTDYNISEKARVWFRGSYEKSGDTGLTSAAIKNSWGPAPVDYQLTGPTVGGHFTYIFTPTLVNEFNTGISIWTEGQILTSSGLAAYQSATYGMNLPSPYPSNNPLNLVPAMSFGGVSDAATVSYDGRFPMNDDARTVSVTDAVSKVWNQHLFKAGVDIEWVRYDQYHQAGSGNFPGSYAFGTDSSNPLDTGYAYANALLGVYDTYTVSTNRVLYAPITRIADWYVQDTWRITPHLTMDAGVRFSWHLPQVAATNQAANFIFSQYNPANAPVLYRPILNAQNQRVAVNPLNGQQFPAAYIGLQVPGSGNPADGMVTAGTAGFPRALVYGTGVLKAPRLAFSWDPFGNGKTAIRFGGGFFYEPRNGSGFLGNMSFNPPLIYTPTNYYGYVEQVTNAQGANSPSSVSLAINTQTRMPTAYNLNFGIQREIGFGTVVDIAYVGTFSRHIAQDRNINEVPFGAEFAAQNQDPSKPGSALSDNFFRPYPGYGSLTWMSFDGNASYHSLQTQVTRRFSKGLQFGVVWTWSKTMDYAEGDQGTVATYVPWNLYNYGEAAIDRAHILTYHYLWDVPKLSHLWNRRLVRGAFDNWQLSGITSFISGQPTGVSFSTSPSVNLTGGGDGARVVVLQNPVLPKDQRTFNEYFDTNAFTTPRVDPAYCAPAADCWGNAAKVLFRGPGVNNWNVSLFKNFIVKERFRSQFRAEAYNAFNHTQFSGVNTSAQFNSQGQQISTTFGQLNAARDPRIMQLALRILF